MRHLGPVGGGPASKRERRYGTGGLALKKRNLFLKKDKQNSGNKTRASGVKKCNGGSKLSRLLDTVIKGDVPKKNHGSGKKRRGRIGKGFAKTVFKGRLGVRFACLIGEDLLKLNDPWVGAKGDPKGQSKTLGGKKNIRDLH